MQRYAATAFAICLLLFVGALVLVSLAEDTAIIDELAHLPAGYSYITRGDMRLNPEHPPLVKDLAGLAVLVWSKASHTAVIFPDQLPSWTKESDGQWQFGSDFYYRFNTSKTEQILFAGRIPTVLTFLGLGGFLFWWTRRRWGALTGVVALTLYAFSPTFLAHTRYVTTDVAAAAAFFFATIAFWRWLERPTPGRLIMAGVVLGVAELVKFSLILLVPVFAIALIVWVALTHWQESTRRLLRATLRSFGQYLVILAVAFGLVVTPIYVLHTWHYPVERQRIDAESNLTITEPNAAVDFVHWSVDKPILRAVGHYIMGGLMVLNRSEYGSSTFFLDRVDNGGRWNYFPVVYFFKEPVPLHLLTAIVLVLTLSWIALHIRQRQLGSAWAREHFLEITFLLVIVAYWGVSMRSSLNIGVRHVLPTLPFLFVLVSRGLVLNIKRLESRRPWFIASCAGLVGLLLWQAVSVIRVHPSYLAYYNELAGGPEGGQHVAADSNLDWGQDLRRLAQFAKARGIERIAVDYFGGGSVEHELPNISYRHRAEDGPVHGWIAISMTFLTFERGAPGKDINKEPNRYAWLDPYEPVAMIGHSIAVYYIP